MTLSPWRPGLLLLSGGLALCACSAEETSLREVRLRSIAELDPWFGASHFVSHSLLLNPEVALVGTPAEQRAFFANQRARQDAAALESARTTLSDATDAQLTEIDVYLRSMSGRSFSAAQVVATGSVWLTDEFPALVLAYCSDRQQVGQPATVAFQAASRKFLEGAGSTNPLQLVYHLVAARISPLDADALGSFAETDAGKAWSNARKRAFASLHQRREAVLSAGVENGVLRDERDPTWQEDLILPDDIRGR